MKTFDAVARSLLIPLCEYKHPSSGGPYFKALYATTNVRFKCFL